MTFDAVVLVGGSGSRLGGVDKAAVALADHELVQASFAAAEDARALVVVGRTSADVPSRAVVTSEDPPGGGPAAGFLAGLDAVQDPAEWTLLLACDVPGAVTATQELLETVQALQAAGEESDGVVLTDPTGRPQWVLGLYRTHAVRRSAQGLSGTENRSLKALLGPLHLTHVNPVGTEWHDVDTWRDHEHWHARLRREPPA